EVARYYTAADIFVFSSMTETQGLVVQEAMTYGLPAVCVGGGGASASIADGVNGFIVRNEAHGFATTVLDVLNNDELYARLADGAAKSVRLHGTEEMCGKVVEVYRDVLAARSMAGDRRFVELR
ncbi:MAG TPA: glycosyltransferase, partial [Fimbriimonadaceae bacterium]|nr:glycosyltransferase [Fimbriimonadaceae bacterium]